MMQDNCSLVALNEQEKIVGLVITRIMPPENRPWYVLSSFS